LGFTYTASSNAGGSGSADKDKVTTLKDIVLKQLEYNKTIGDTLGILKSLNDLNNIYYT
jgi:hypothetical protein